MYVLLLAVAHAGVGVLLCRVAKTRRSEVAWTFGYWANAVSVALAGFGLHAGEHTWLLAPLLVLFLYFIFKAENAPVSPGRVDADLRMCEAAREAVDMHVAMTQVYRQRVRDGADRGLTAGADE